jgi:hypothetical protein
MDPEWLMSGAGACGMRTSLGVHATVFQADTFTILAYAREQHRKANIISVQIARRLGQTLRIKVDVDKQICALATVGFWAMKIKMPWLDGIKQSVSWCQTTNQISPRVGRPKIKARSDKMLPHRT